MISRYYQVICFEEIHLLSEAVWSWMIKNR